MNSRRPWFHWTLLAAALLVLAPASSRAEIPLSLYGDIDYKYTKDQTGASSFSVPRVELFYSGNYDRLSYLAEVMFEAANNAYTFDIERVQLTYTFADWARISAGRFHTSIGYYNDAFHHGYYFVLTTERPTAVDFEDSNGLIPAHLVGLQADGRIRLGDNLAIRYDAEVGNGRGNPGEVTLQFARHLEPAMNFRLRFEPGGALDGLLIGGNIYHDQIPTLAGSIVYPMRELILGAHAAYFENNIHFVAEYMWIQHQEFDGGTNTYKTNAFFAELGYTLKDAWTPYVRYENTKFGSTPDPFFTAEAVVDSGGNAAPNDLGPDRGSYQRGTIGVRYIFNEHVALKVEGQLQYFSDAVSAGRTTVYTAKTQIAVAF